MFIFIAWGAGFSITVNRSCFHLPYTGSWNSGAVEVSIQYIAHFKNLAKGCIWKLSLACTYLSRLRLTGASLLSQKHTRERSDIRPRDDDKERWCQASQASEPVVEHTLSCLLLFVFVYEFTPWRIWWDGLPSPFLVVFPCFWVLRYCCRGFWLPSWHVDPHCPSCAWPFWAIPWCITMICLV